MKNKLSFPLRVAQANIPPNPPSVMIPIRQSMTHKNRPHVSIYILLVETFKNLLQIGNMRVDFAAFRGYFRTELEMSGFAEWANSRYGRVTRETKSKARFPERTYRWKALRS